jgi:hypothetical protein
MREDRTVYILPSITLSRVITALNTLGFKVIVTSQVDYKFLVSNGIETRIASSFYHIINQFTRSGLQDAELIRNEFDRKLAQIHTLTEEPRILAELALLMDSEAESYELVQKHGIYYNAKRACYLDNLKLAIDIIAQTPMTFDGLYRALKSSCRDLTVMSVIITAIKTEVFIQDPRTTIISMK